MPLLDSFKVDHTIMQAPAVRLAKKINQDGFVVTVWDLRFCVPNKEIMPVRGTHTFEHLYAGFMRAHLTGFTIIDISPMGCRTGFYMSVIGEPAADKIVSAWSASMTDILNVKSMADIPELNEYQCGTFKMHSLNEAKGIAKHVLDCGIRVNSNEVLTLSDSKIAEAYKPATEAEDPVDTETLQLLAGASSWDDLQKKLPADKMAFVVRGMAEMLLQGR